MQFIRCAPQYSPLFFLFIGLKVESRRVDAVALTGRLRTVRKDVPEVGATPCTNDLCATHSMTVIRAELDVPLLNDVVEAWPTTPGLKLGVRIEERRVADDAAVGPVLFVIPILSGECLLRPCFLRNVVLLVRQLLPKLLVGRALLVGFRHKGLI